MSPFTLPRRLVSLLTGITGTLGLANGGTGGTTQATARAGLGLGTASTKAVGIEPDNVLPHWASIKS